MIHVAYRLWGGDGFYAKMLGTSMLSMFENTRERVTVHIMHNDRLTPDNRGKFCYIAGQYNQQIEFHNVEEIAGDTLRQFEAVHPIKSGMNGSWYPLIIHKVFPHLDKLIFLGADTVFNQIDVGELWAYDLDTMGEGYGFGAAVDLNVAIHPLIRDGFVKHEDWFNVDVLLVKPDFFRENFEQILEACRFVYNNGYYFYENDALNYLFSTKYLRLPYRFNSIAYDIRSKYPKSHRLEKAIYHYAGLKPWFDTDDVFNWLYLEYFLKTPWATADMFGNLNKATEKLFRHVNNDLKNTLLQLTNLLARRERAFIVSKSSLTAIMHIFEIKDEEPIIDASEINENENIIAALTECKGQKIFFVLTENYSQVKSFLLSQNFVEGTDFINGVVMLSEQHGLKENFNPYSQMLFQEM